MKNLSVALALAVMTVTSVSLAAEKPSLYQLDLAMGASAETIAIFTDREHDSHGSTPSVTHGRLELRAGLRLVDSEYFHLMLQAPLEIGLGGNLPWAFIPGIELGLGRYIDIS